MAYKGCFGVEWCNGLLIGLKINQPFNSSFRLSGLPDIFAKGKKKMQKLEQVKEMVVSCRITFTYILYYTRGVPLIKNDITSHNDTFATWNSSLLWGRS